jgi:hypothetical protein
MPQQDFGLWVISMSIKYINTYYISVLIAFKLKLRMLKTVLKGILGMVINI